MMDNMGREKFWNVLKELHDDSESSLSMLTEASKWPSTICRFRPVSEHSLQQLEENKLFFSSADHYDDPFDTYFYIDVDQMVPVYDELRNDLLKGNEEFVNKLRQIAKFADMKPDTFIDMLSNISLDFTELKGQLTMVRNMIQRRFFSICFCEDPYNESLWLKYAENYSGFVQLYDLASPDTFLCGTEMICRDCIQARERPYIFPIYYSDDRYDATKYALGIWLMGKIEKQNNMALKPLHSYVWDSLIWEIERISLIKKKCHENDQEWRMIRPAMHEQRSCIKMKPCKVIIGLRTPEYESRLIVSAAKIAGIQEIHKVYINDSDKLDSKPVQAELYYP